MRTFKWFYLLLCCLVCTSIYGQGEFNVNIYLNKNIDIDKVIISVDNGKVEYDPEKSIKEDEISITGKYYGEYAEILVRYPSEYSSNFMLFNSFFVQDKPATIRFDVVDSAADLLNNYSLVHATDFKAEKEKMKKYDSAELEKSEDFASKYGSEIFKDSTLEKQYFDMVREVYQRDLDYIIDNPDSYYTFSFFRRNIVMPHRISSDSIYTVLNKFPQRFKESEEGNTIRKLVEGRRTVRFNGQAPDFKSEDISGKMISLESYKNKNYVLLNFWATWCGPCIQEMPVIKEIKDTYSQKGLTVISVAYPSTYAAYLKGVKNNNMNWINIYNDVDLINTYGGYKPIPRLYLIDKGGKIIYDRIESQDDAGLNKLKKLLSGKLGGG